MDTAGGEEEKVLLTAADIKNLPVYLCVLVPLLRERGLPGLLSLRELEEA